MFLADFNDKLTCWELNNVSSFSVTTSTNSKMLQKIDRFVLIWNEIILLLKFHANTGSCSKSTYPSVNENDVF